MLTLDTLRRMADRMPSEPVGDSGKPLYRRPDPDRRVRVVALPTVRDEARRAMSLFGFVVAVALVMLDASGVLHSEDGTQTWSL